MKFNGNFNKFMNNKFYSKFNTKINPKSRLICFNNFIQTVKITLLKQRNLSVRLINNCINNSCIAKSSFKSSLSLSQVSLVSFFNYIGISNLFYCFFTRNFNLIVKSLNKSRDTTKKGLIIS